MSRPVGSVNYKGRDAQQPARTRLAPAVDPGEATRHLRALEELAPQLPFAARRETLGGLARLEALLRVDLIAEASGSVTEGQEDRLLSAPEAAARLSVTPEYLYRHAHQLPFTVHLGRAVRFSSAGMDEFIRTRRGR